MQGTFTDEVAGILEVLEKRIGEKKFSIWFKDSTRLTVADGYLKVGVGNLFLARWLENHFLSVLQQCAMDATGSSKKVVFAVDAELAGKQKRTGLSTEQKPVAKVQQRSVHKPASKRSSFQKLKLGLDSYVVGSSNELAFNAAKAVATSEKSPFNPLFVHGGYGVGKTHLLQGICAEVSKQRPGLNWLYLSAEDFANQFILALKTKKLEAFRARMRQTDLLAIDDVHFLASKLSTQEEFLHTFNTIDLAGKQVILASDAHPKMIQQLSEKLVNRFVSGMVVKVESPDFATRCAICEQYASKMKVEIPENVIRFVCENMRTNVRELQGALVKISAFAALQNHKVTIALAKSVLDEHLARTDPIVHISDIESCVATYFELTPSVIHSSRKDRTVALARHLSMYLARNYTKMSSTEIGRFLGNKNHATVLLACRKMEKQIKANAEFHWKCSTGHRVMKAKKVVEQLETSISG